MVLYRFHTRLANAGFQQDEEVMIRMMGWFHTWFHTPVSYLIVVVWFHTRFHTRFHTLVSYPGFIPRFHTLVFVRTRNHPVSHPLKMDAAMCVAVKLQSVFVLASRSPHTKFL